MKNKQFYWEIRDLKNQFVSAFDDVIISRYNENKVEQDRIQVQYTFAPKQRVLHDLVNKSKHIRLPVVSVVQNSVSWDKSRVFNKGYGAYINKGITDDFLTPTGYYIPQPVPVNLGLTMTIMTRYGLDMDQILSNFLPYTNPYIIISWKIPTEFIGEQSQTREIRSVVRWSGDISQEYPTDLAPDTPARITATTSFTIEGWIFPKAPDNETQNIIYVDSTIIPVSSVNIDDY